MEDYIRNAFKSLEDLNVIIEPKSNKLREDLDVEIDEPVTAEDIRGLFENESSYILTHDFEFDGHDYSLFLEALHEGESCDIEFEEFDIGNIDSVLVEVLDSEHEFIGSLTGEDITLDTALSEVISKAENLISGGGEEEIIVTSDEHEEGEEEEANERIFVSGDPDSNVEVDVDETEVKEEVLNESESFNLNSKEEVEEADKVLKKDDDETIEQIVDASAESKEDLKKSYVGSIILQCPTCKSMMYKDPDQLVKVEGEEELYNIDEECPHCGAKDGFEIVGQVASLDVDPEAEPVPPMVEPEVEVEKEEEVKVEDNIPEEEDVVDLELGKDETNEDLTPEDSTEKDKEEAEEKEDSEVEDKDEESKEKEEEEEKSGEQPLNEDHCEIKLTTEEKNVLDKLTHGNKMDTWFWIDDETDTIKDLEDNEKVLDTCEAILTVADGTEDIEEFLTGEEIKIFNDLVARCKECKGGVKEDVKESEEEKHVCEKCGKEVCECDKGTKEEEIKLESFDEDKFDKLVTRYLKETYSNVKSYKTTSAGLDDTTNKVVMEGTIAFKSGKEKPTKFMFEAKEINAKNQLKLVGINEMFSKSKAFTLVGTVNNNKLLSESLAYRYDVDGKKVRGRAESFKKR